LVELDPNLRLSTLLSHAITDDRRRLRASSTIHTCSYAHTDTVDPKICLRALEMPWTRHHNPNDIIVQDGII